VDLKEDTRAAKEQAETDYAMARTQQEAERAEVRCAAGTYFLSDTWNVWMHAHLK
jgi:hypothetical protein